MLRCNATHPDWIYDTQAMGWIPGGQYLYADRFVHGYQELSQARASEPRNSEQTAGHVMRPLPTETNHLRKNHP